MKTFFKMFFIEKQIIIFYFKSNYIVTHELGVCFIIMIFLFTLQRYGCLCHICKYYHIFFFKSIHFFLKKQRFYIKLVVTTLIKPRIVI